MEAMFGVLYDVDLNRHTWPAEIPMAARSTAWLAVTVADVPVSMWMLPADQRMEVFMCRPVWPGARLHRSAWVPYTARMLPQAMWNAQAASWTQLLQTEHKVVFPAALAMCVHAVLDSLEANSADVEWMPGQPRNIKNNWRRRANGVLRAVTAAARGDLFAADSLGDWLQQVPLTHSWCQPRLNWSTFMREPPLLPWVTFKVSTCQAFLREPMVKVLALCRRVWHQNMLYQMFAEPILSHVVGVVGQSTKAGTRIWGDFRTVKNVPGLRFCPCWAASLSNEILVQNYQNLWWDEFRNSQQTVSQFWQAGRRISCLSFSPDGHSMLVDLGNKENLPQALRFDRGSTLYMVVFASVHQLAFEQKCFSEAMRMMEQSGVSPDTLKQLLGSDRQNIRNPFQTWFPHGVLPAVSTQLDQEQQDLVRQIVQEPGCVHSIWSPPGGGKSFVLAALLASWAPQAAANALAFYVTNRKKHREPMLRQLRRALQPDQVYVLAGQIEDPDTDVHIQAHLEAASKEQLAEVLHRLGDLDSNIDVVAPELPLDAILPLHAERVQILFCNYLWKKWKAKCNSCNRSRCW